jgi:putative membrane protein
MTVLGSWLALSLAFWLTTVLLPGFQVKGFTSTLVVAALFGLLNWLIGAYLVGFFGLLAILTGPFAPMVARWVANLVLLKVVGFATRRLEIKETRTLLVAALLISVLGTLTEFLVLRIV